MIARVAHLVEVVGDGVVAQAGPEEELGGVALEGEAVRQAVRMPDQLALEHAAVDAAQ